MGTIAEEKVDYIDVIELRNEIRRYKAQPPGSQMADSLGIMLVKIAEHLATKPCFSDYSFKEDFISDAVARMVQYVGNIDPDDSRSPFSYLTLTSLRCFIAKIKQEKKQVTTQNNLATLVWSHLGTSGEVEAGRDCENPNYKSDDGED